MELAFLDKNFNLIKYFNYINLQWIRRYYEPGQFMVQIPADQYVPGAEYVFNSSRPELGMIQKFEYEHRTTGRLILLSGYFYEFKLNDKITYPRFRQSGNIETVARSIVDKYKDDIPLLEFADANNPLLGESVAKQTTGDGLASALYSLLKTQQMSYACVYDYVNKKIRFKVWQGLDRTQTQTQNSFASFSEKLRNIQNEKITKDTTLSKNYAIVIGNGSYEEGRQVSVTVDLRANPSDYRRVVYIDKTAEIYDSTKETLDAYKSRLIQAGKEDLQKKHASILNVSFDVVRNNGLRYMEDFDLGDKCDLLIDDFQMAFQVRLTEVREVFKHSVHEISLTFGDKVPVAYRK